MTNHPTVIAVIPAYNEEKVIAQLIRDIKKEKIKTIIVVDDGSNDNTYIKAHQMKAIVLRHSLNRGKGAAIKTGIEAAKWLHAESVITIDGDGQHNPKDIQTLLRTLNLGYDVVLGYRMQNRQTMPWLKRMANYSANLLTWILYGLWVHDSQCGLRAYSKKALDCIDTQHDQYEYDSEIIREIQYNKLKFYEVPVQTVYTKYSMTKPSKQGFTNGIKTFIHMVIST